MQTKSWRNFTQTKGIYANQTDIHGKSEYKLVWYSLGRRKRKQSENTDRDRTPRIAAGRNSKLHLTHARSAASVGK